VQRPITYDHTRHRKRSLSPQYLRSYTDWCKTTVAWRGAIGRGARNRVSFTNFGPKPNIFVETRFLSLVAWEAIGRACSLYFSGRSPFVVSTKRACPGVRERRSPCKVVLRKVLIQSTYLQDQSSSQMTTEPATSTESNGLVPGKSLKLPSALRLFTPPLIMS